MAATVPITIRTRVEAPRDLVWRVLADLDRQPEWMREVLDVQLVSPGPLAVGSHMRAPSRFQLQRTPDDMEVTAFAPPKRFGGRPGGIIQGEGEFLLIENEDGVSTEVLWTEDLGIPLGTVGHLGVRMMAPILRSQFDQDLRRLRRLCESEQRAES